MDSYHGNREAGTKNIFYTTSLIPPPTFSLLSGASSHIHHRALASQSRMHVAAAADSETPNVSETLQHTERCEYEQHGVGVWKCSELIHVNQSRILSLCPQSLLLHDYIPLLSRSGFGSTSLSAWSRTSTDTDTSPTFHGENEICFPLGGVLVFGPRRRRGALQARGLLMGSRAGAAV